MNYFVGITKNKEWKLLSNGAETYEYIDPYSFSLKDAFEGKSNQIKKWSTSFDQLQFYCKKNNMKLLAPQEGGWFSQKIEHEVLEREFKEVLNKSV